MGSGVASTCVEVLWRILGFLFSLSFPFLFCFSFISWNCLVFFTCHKSYVCQSQNSSSLLFFCFFLSKSFFSCSISSSGKHLSCFSLHGLGPKGGDRGTSIHLAYHLSTSAPIHHHGDTFHFHLLVCAAWGSIPVQGSILTNLGFHPHPRFHPHHLCSMTTLSLPP